VALHIRCRRRVPRHMLTQGNLEGHRRAHRVPHEEIALAEAVLVLQDSNRRQDVIDVVGMLRPA
jgi:hypothetical protein